MCKRFSKLFAVLLTLCLLSMTCTTALTAEASETDGYPDFSYIGAYGGLSQTEVETVCKSIYDQLAQRTTPITVNLGRNLSVNEANTIADLIFEVSHNHAVGILFDGTSPMSYGYGSRFEANVAYFDNGSAQTYNNLINSLDEILAGVHEDWTDVEKALYLHDLIAVDFDYDNAGLVTGNTKHFVYQFLTTNNEAVCDAYASLYSYLLNRIDIPCVKIAISKNVHAWNAVKIGDAWYYVDITHDDSYHGYHPGLLSHDYFLNSETDNLNTRTSSGNWKGDASEWALVCEKNLQETNLNISKTDSVQGFWEGIKTAITPIGSEWLVADSENEQSKGPYSIKIMNIDGDKTEIYRNETGGWDYSYTQGGYIYSDLMPGKYMIPIYYDNVVFFTTGNAIYGLYNNTNSAVPVAVAELNNSSDHTLKIYGMKKSGSKLIYYYATTPTPQFNSSTLNFDNPGVAAEIDLNEAVSTVKQANANAAKWTANYKTSDGKGSFTVAATESMDGFAAPTNLVLGTGDYCYQNGWYADSSLTTAYDFSKVLKSDIDLYGEYYECVPQGVYAALDGNIRMNFVFKMNSAMLNDSSAKAVFTITNGDSVRTVEVPFSEAAASEMSEEGYEIPVEIYSREMDAQIKLDVVSEHINYSWNDTNIKCVYDYLDTISANGNQSEKVVNMAKATKNYGVYANLYFDGGSSESDVNLTNDQMQKLENRKAITTGSISSDAGYSYVGSSLILENTTAIRHYFKVKSEDNKPTVKIDGTEQQLIKKSGIGNVYYVEIENISANELKTAHKVTVDSMEMNYSACSYMYKAVNKVNPTDKQQILCNTMKAMFLYALAAEDMNAA
ncbi:MAG: hypothetical protein IIY78_00585 [Clostridia bacterium]|nr:hypothetical protein [Clostridia bacterium]